MSDSKNSETADLPAEIVEDTAEPIIEIPMISGNEYLKKSQIAATDIRGMVVRCTSCLHQINHHDSDKVWKHYRLNVIVCKECHEFYGTSEFSQDESGNYNYCTWCGNGGKLFLCDFCPNAFCSTCVRRNFGRAEVSKMSREGWKCYCCEPNKLKAKVAYCDLIIAYSKKAKLKDKKNDFQSGGSKIIKKTSDENWTKSQEWILLAFDEVDDSSKLLHKRLDKLKNIGIAQSKSVKHIIKKLEEVVNNHKSELNHIIKTLSHTYNSYLDAKKLEEGTKNEKNVKKVIEEPKEKPDTENVIKVEGSGSSKEASVNVDSLPPDANKIDPNYSAKLLLLKDSASSESEKEPASSDSESKPNEIELADEQSQDIFPDQEPETKDIPLSKPLVNGTSHVSEESPTEAKSEVNNKPRVEVEETAKENVWTVEEIVSKIILPSKSKKKVTKKSVTRKLEFVDLSSGSGGRSSSSIIVSSDSDSVKKTPKITPKKARKERKPLDPSDPKLKLKPVLVLESCDHLLPNGETTIPLPEEYILADLDKEIKSLCKLPKEKVKSKSAGVPEKPKEKKQKKAPEPKKKKVVESSSSISFSSSQEEEEPVHKKKLPITKDKLDANSLAKQQLLESDGSSYSSDSLISGSDEEVKKKKSKKPKGKSDSSDDFQPRKKRKFDKLLSKRILSDDENSKGSEKKPFDRKKTKRKQPASDDVKSDKSGDSNSENTTTSESEEEKQKKKKRRRIKKAADSSSEEEKSKDKDAEGSQNTPGKHRKNIKKILSKTELAEETREAQEAEKERRRRVMERQKMYNMITDTAKDSNEIVTRKMVLEIDPESKEEIVEIHPDLVQKLKPHQVKGVKFMWECTIESVKELKKKDSKGSGCILAHCMGLGKTLQVITFLHTCLTNEHVKNKIRTAMVICPYNTILNWAREFETWLKDIDGEILIHELAQAKDNYTRLDIIKYWQRDGGVLIISYDIFRRLANPAKKGLRLPKAKKEKLLDLLVDPGPDIVVCDEGHALKNVKSAISIACSKFSTERRVVLTGTPLQNNLLEYHCMLSFVKPHLLGTPKEFRNRFVNPIMNGQYDDSNDHDVKRMKKRIHILHKLLGGCVQRCDYSALTKFLPPKHEYVINVKLSEVQIKMYRYYLDNLSKHKQDEKMQGGTLFQDYNILMNLCTHPFIVHKSFMRSERRKVLREDCEDEDEYEKDFIDDGTEESKSGSGSSNSDKEEVVRSYRTRSRLKDGESDVEEIEEDVPVRNWYHEFISEEDKFKIELSGKMILLTDILRECDAIGDKVILFSQSILTLDTVEEMLEFLDEQPLSDEDKQRDVRGSWVKGLDYFRMDGTTSAEFRKNFIDMFNNPKNDRARLFLVSTKAGGLGTNLVGANRVVMLDASWNPSHDVQAIFRVYRFGQTKPVYIYRLLAHGTMEEKIYDRQVTKLSLSIRVVDEQQIDRHFNADQLAELYKFEPESLDSNKPTPMVPKDTLLAEMLKTRKNWILTYHEHDSLLQNETEEDLTEEERQAAWAEYENEREGRYTEEIGIDDEIAQYIKEPDFNEADYAGSVIASVKIMIEEIISNLKLKYPKHSPPELRKKLLLHIFRLRALFQDKHVRVLRMKQDYVANGAVPQSINKYLQELNVVLRDLTVHYENIQQLVKHDQTVAMDQYREQMKKQAAFHAAQAAKQMPHGNAMPNQQFPGRAPSYRPGYQGFPQNVQYGGYAVPNTGMPFIGQNATLQNIRIGMMNYANRFKYANQNAPTAHNSMPPIITEVVDVENERGDTTLPERKSSNAQSSVVIEEVE